MADPVTGGAPKSGRLLKILLFVSLAANLLIVGWVGGVLLRNSDSAEGRRPPPAAAFGIGSLAQALPVEERRSLGRAMMRELRKNRMSRSELRENTDRFVTILETTPYDATAAEAALSVQVEEASARLGLAKTLFLQRVAEMSAEERLDLAQSISEGIKAGPRGPGGPGARPKRGEPREPETGN